MFETKPRNRVMGFYVFHVKQYSGPHYVSVMLDLFFFSFGKQLSSSGSQNVIKVQIILHVRLVFFIIIIIDIFSEYLFKRTRKKKNYFVIVLTFF